MAQPLYIILSVCAILLVVMAQRGYSWSVLITKNIFCSNRASILAFNRLSTITSQLIFS